MHEQIHLYHNPLWEKILHCNQNSFCFNHSFDTILSICMPFKCLYTFQTGHLHPVPWHTFILILALTVQCIFTENIPWFFSQEPSTCAQIQAQSLLEWHLDKKRQHSLWMSYRCKKIKKLLQITDTEKTFRTWNWNFTKYVQGETIQDQCRKHHGNNFGPAVLLKEN